MKTKTIYIMLILTLILSCTAHENDHAHDESEENKNENSVEITATQMDVAELKLGSFENRKMKNTIKANGVLELPPQNRANISPLMGGTVKGIKVIEGDFVDENQTLLLLQHTDFIQLQQDYLEALNRKEYLKAEYQRKNELYEENISSGKQFQQVQMEYKSNISSVRSLESKLRLLNLDIEKLQAGHIQSFVEIQSPIHGYVRNIETSIGSYVSPNEKIIEIIDNHHIHIDLLVYENDITDVKVGQQVSFKVASLKNIEHQARVFAVGKAFEKDLKAVRVHAEIENADNTLLPGMYVDARIITNNEEVAALPESALHREGEKNFIFIQNEHNTKSDKEHFSFKKIPVKVGIVDDGYVQILPYEKLDDNVTIVIHGNYYLDAELNKGEAEHHH